MHRYLALASIFLAIAVGLALGAVVWEIGRPDSSELAFDKPDPAIGRAFYAAVNRTLAGGNGADLVAEVRDTFVDHTDSNGDGDSIDGLVNRLGEYGLLFPGARLEIHSLRAEGGNLIAEISPVMPAPGRVAGFPLTMPDLPDGIEVLRIVRGKVTERWSMTMPHLTGVSFDPIWGTAPGHSEITAWLFRIDLPAGGYLHWLSDGISFVLAESGTLEVTTDENNDRGTPVHQSASVTVGSAMSIPPSTQLELRGQRDKSSRLLLFSVHEVGAPMPWPFNLKRGASSKLLWNSAGPFAVSAPWSVRIARVVLPAHTGVTLGETRASELVVVSEDGRATLSTEGGSFVPAGCRLSCRAALIGGGACLLVQRCSYRTHLQLIFVYCGRRDLRLADRDGPASPQGTAQTGNSSRARASIHPTRHKAALLIASDEYAMQRLCICCLVGSIARGWFDRRPYRSSDWVCVLCRDRSGAGGERSVRAEAGGYGRFHRPPG